MDIESLILNNKNLIYKLAHYFNYPDKEDLFQCGCVGLIKAYKKFDSKMQTKFTTYAYSYILGEMKKCVREDKSIKINKDINDLCNKIDKVRSFLEQKLMKIPSNYEIAYFLGVSEEEVGYAINSINKVRSIDEVVGDDLNLHEIIGSKTIDIDLLLSLKYELDNLTPLEKEIIKKRYIEDLTQEEVSRTLGISQVEVSRKEHKAKKLIKERIHN